MINNGYFLFIFEYTFYNYSANKVIKDIERIKAKSIDDAESIFWGIMNGRDVKIKKVLCKMRSRLYRTYKQSPRYNCNFVSDSYTYLDDGKTRIM